VLAAATRLFAAQGFKKVTVRAICRAARANVAAVNYHFGDKMGLYREVLGAAIETMRSTTELAQREGEGRPVEEQLAIYVRVFIDRVVRASRDSWIHQLMIREMTDPTPGLDLVIDQVIRPRMAYVSGLVAGILRADPGDERVVRCALSVQSQFNALMNTQLATRLVPGLLDDPDALRKLADHITAFSLAGIRAQR
jgi:AcrR family transcriptional regulator